MRHFNNKIAEIIRQYKLDYGCSVCGFNGNYAALHFHHIDATFKEGAIAEIIKSNDYVAVLTELKKCTILCANCHSVYHNTEVLERELMESKFILIDIQEFIDRCILAEAIVNKITVSDFDLLARITALEEEVKKLTDRLMAKAPLMIKTTTTTEYKPLDISEDLIVSTYQRLGSLNKTTRALFNGKVGAYYTDKIKPVLDKHNIDYT